MEQMKNQCSMEETRLIKLVLFLGIVFVGFVAYTGIDVTQEYQAVSEIRDNALTKVVDPLSKTVLSGAANSNLDEIINGAVNKLKDAGGNQ